MEFAHFSSARRCRQGLSAAGYRRALTKGEQNIVLGILSNRGDLDESLRVRRETNGRCRQSAVVTVYDNNDEDNNSDNNDVTLTKARHRDIRSHADAWHIGRAPLAYCQQLAPLSGVTSARSAQADDGRDQSHSRKSSRSRGNICDSLIGRQTTNYRLPFIVDNLTSSSTNHQLEALASASRLHMHTTNSIDPFRISKLSISSNDNDLDSVTINDKKDFQRQNKINVYLPKVDSEM